VNDLEIPDRAISAIIDMVSHSEATLRVVGAYDLSQEIIKAAGPVLVAWKLRRLANTNDPVARVARVWLLAEADELDPEGKALS
jgi:hypothetical protein